MEDRYYEVEDELGRRHNYIGSIGDALIATGIIFWRDNRWCIKAADVDIIEHKRMDLAVCDFCSDRPVTFSIDADDFEDAFGNRSVNGWTACEVCGLLVTAGDRAGLQRRMLHVAQDRHPAILQMLREHLRLFWRHYKGIKRVPARPFGH